MKFVIRLAMVALPVMVAAGCTTLGVDDKATIEKANMVAGEAKSAAELAVVRAERAAKVAENAAAAAERAAAAASRAAAEAKAAGDKADRIFRKNLRK